MAGARTRQRTRSLVPSSPALGLTVLGQDSFTDTNGTDLAAHTPEVGTWVDSAANCFEIQSNTCAPANVIGTSLMEGPTTRGVISWTMPTSFGAVSGFSIVAHFVDTNNMLSVLSFGNLILAEITGGVAVQQVDTGVAPANGQSFVLLLEGRRARILINGNDRGALTFAEAKVAEASHGFRQPAGTTTGRIDNWLMYG